jgi:hypothetical protein
MVEIDTVTATVSTRQKRREAAERAKKRNRQTELARRFKRAKQERDGEIWCIYAGYQVIAELPDSKLWKPRNKREGRYE